MPTIDELTKQVTELTSTVKTLSGKPDFSGIHRDAEGRVTGQWSDTDESVTIVTGRDDLAGPRAGRRLKSRAAMTFAQLI